MEAYRRAGVDLGAADVAVEGYRQIALGATRPEVMAGVGGFAGLFRLGAYHDPVLVAGADGVGTKVKLARQVGRLTTVGIDCVAMCVNDILCHGAEPLFFLDYLAVAKLDPAEAAQIVGGVAVGCREAGCALLGGETAEMPGVYHERDFDLAGFAVGVCEKDALLGPERVQPGDVLIGLRSSGLHSNGFSLVRRWLQESKAAAEHDEALIQALLEPTRIYTRAVLAAVQSGGLRAAAHVTGGGIPGNLSRVLGGRCDASIDLRHVPLPPVYDWVRSQNVRGDDLVQTFNFGVGMILIADAATMPKVLAALAESGEQPLELGTLRAGTGVVTCALPF